MQQKAHEAPTQTHDEEATMVVWRDAVLSSRSSDRTRSSNIALFKPVSLYPISSSLHLPHSRYRILAAHRYTSPQGTSSPCSTPYLGASMPVSPRSSRSELLTIPLHSLIRPGQKERQNVQTNIQKLPGVGKRFLYMGFWRNQSQKFVTKIPLGKTLFSHGLPCDHSILVNHSSVAGSFEQVESSPFERLEMSRCFY